MDETEGTSPLHLAIVGGGVAGCAAASWAAGQGARVTLFNAGLPLGGSCLHTTTLPTRVSMSAATDYRRGADPPFGSANPEVRPPRWEALSKRRGELSARMANLQYFQLNRRPNVEIVEARASFVGQQSLRADNRLFEPDRILLTPGSHPHWPQIQGLSDVDPMTIAGLQRIGGQPASVNFIEISDPSLACAQALARLGTAVTMITESSELFAHHDSPESSDMIAEILSDEGVEIVFDAVVTHAEPTGKGARLMGTVDGRPAQWDSEKVVVIDHRTPHVDDLNLEAAGIDLTEEGFIIVDEALRTTNHAVFAAGDAVGRGYHSYAAAYDAVLASHNAICLARTAGHNTAVPFAVYTDPQFAGVGWDERRARQVGFEADSAAFPIDEVPAAAALGYDRGFVKLIRDRRSDHLLGARIVAPNASELIMELSLALRHGLTISELATLVRPPISLGEAIGRTARMLLHSDAKPT